MLRSRFLAGSALICCLGFVAAPADGGPATHPTPFYPFYWTVVASGGQTSCGITTDTHLWCWGDSEQGQTGIGDHGHSASTSAPYQVAAPSTWTTVTVGGHHACGVQTDGTLWCWGSNHHGELGIGGHTLQDRPHKVGTATSWKTVSAGDAHTCGLRADHTLWCWGSNDHGQLGIGSTKAASKPVQVGGDSWASVSAGGDHTCATKTDDSLWCWGDNADGELGTGSTKQQTSPVHVGTSTWAQVSAGISHTCAIDHDGALWCWGADGARHSTVPRRVGSGSSWKSVSAGNHDTCATQRGGAIFCWGTNDHGQLGQGDVVRRAQPTQITFRTGWTAVVEGGSTTCAIRDDTTLWCWGLDRFGQVGDHAREDRFYPTTVNFSTRWRYVSRSGGYHTCAISDVVNQAGWLYCWGINEDGQVGDGSTKDVVLPEHIGKATWKQVSGGEAYTCGVQSKGTLWCWGANDHGQLGNGTTTSSTTPVQVGTAKSWSQVSAGTDHTCAVRTDGSLWCWGDNADGELGDGSTSDSSTPQQVGAKGTTWTAVSAGLSHTCAIQADKSLWCWGDNADGELGDGTHTQRLVPIAVSGGGSWSMIDVGGDDSCGLQPSGSGGALYCWGQDNHGQAGLGGGADVLAPTHVGSGIWLSVTVGLDHSCGAQTSTTLWCWGVAKDGDLGDGKRHGEEDTPSRMSYQKDDPWVAAYAYDDSTCGLKNFTESFGDDSHGQLGDGSPAQARLMPTTIFVIPK